MNPLPVAQVQVDRSDPSELIESEWLVTNGIGGYASSTVAGMNTRRYHGLLVAATQPPAGRRVLLAHLVDELHADGKVFALSTSEYEDGTVHPEGWKRLLAFRLVGTRPVFTYQAGEHRIEKSIWMDHGRNQTWIRYTHLAGPGPATLRLLPLVTNRDFHSETASDQVPFTGSEPVGGSISIKFENRPSLVLEVEGADVELSEGWFWNAAHRRERARGFDWVEDLLSPCVIQVELNPGSSISLSAYVGDPAETTADESLETFDRRARELIARSPDAGDAANRRLVLAADQFLVGRGGREAGTVIAGYHWFGDWGRDTMIALPGLALSTGRPEVMRDIIVDYAGYVSQGMLPNRFPDAGGDPEYNTVDATLWWFEALAKYLRASEEYSILDSVLTTMVSVIDWHVRGTRYGIRVDPDDGLLLAGEHGSQLTWMDARAGDWVVTPRMGKPVEVNALWYSALRLLERWLRVAGMDSVKTRALADRVAVSFRKRFWNQELGYLYDVVDGPDGNDASLRPNQLIALSVSHPLIHGELARSIVRAARDHLLTPFGLRTLSPTDAAYAGSYRGGPLERDGAYHRGTVWPWLIGPFVDAHIHAYGSAEGLRGVLDDLVAQLDQAGLGSIAEIFSGDPPHTPDGCIAQAWSVAEVLRSRARIAEPSAT